MKNYFRKFGVMCVMSGILALGTCVSAFADDSVEIGTKNLNNTAQNSAKIWTSILLHPEIGWKRYDDTNSTFVITGSSNVNNTNNSAFIGPKEEYASYFYKGSDLLLPYVAVNSNKQNFSIKFKFYGTKLRIIGSEAAQLVSSDPITIDNKVDYLAENHPNSGFTWTSETLVYEKKDLPLGMHEVIITQNNFAQNFVFDALDIDGELLPYNESISLNKSSLDLSVGNSEQLTATTTPAAVGVTWKSSDESVATVDSNGKVTGIKAGQATVTATTADGSNLSSSCTVNVKDVSPTVVSLSVTPEEAKLMPGEQKQLQVIATMSDGSTKDVTDGSTGTTYSSDYEDAATVDANGLVSESRSAEIGARTFIYASYGGKTASSFIVAGQETTN
ncbi:Ig-like domain-containing protein [uncultured Clostridium sp.]|uniref:Ig-like domain-containing protein n=1 Tax=uncultured Clostridium sp. TaxID=59620 RepID=UPI0028F04D6F|nr:Ig-like domain-containing protein [uncultured Clostridium sp.]